MHKTQYSHLTNEEFYRLLVSQPVLTPMETEAMIRIEALMDEDDGWDGPADEFEEGMESIRQAYEETVDGGE